MSSTRVTAVVFLAMSANLCGMVSAQQVEAIDDAASTAQEAAEERIQAALARVVPLESKERTLSELVAYLNNHGLPCQLDQRALEDLGLAPSTSFPIPPRGLTLRSTLSVILESLDLTWAIRHERLLITSKDAAETYIKPRVYDARLLVEEMPYSSGGAGGAYDFDTLIDLVTTTIAPHTWDDVGGEGSIHGYELNGVPLLVIAQTDDVLHQVEGLFSQLKSASGGARFPRRIPRSSLSLSRTMPRAGQRRERSADFGGEPTVPAPSWSTAKIYD